MSVSIIAATRRPVINADGGKPGTGAGAKVDVVGDDVSEVVAVADGVGEGVVVVVVGDGEVDAEDSLVIELVVAEVVVMVGDAMTMCAQPG